jgi:hypothetical protein
MMPIVYWVWMTISIFVAHWLTDIAGIEQYATKEKFGYVLLFLVYFIVLIFFDIIWGAVV